jgi:hypothetical protein
LDKDELTDLKEQGKIAREKWTFNWLNENINQFNSGGKFK